MRIHVDICSDADHASIGERYALYPPLVHLLSQSRCAFYLGALFRPEFDGDGDDKGKDRDLLPFSDDAID